MNLLVVTPLPLVWWRPHTPAPPFQLKHLTFLALSWRNSHHSLIKLQVEWWVLGRCYTQTTCRNLVLIFAMMYSMVWLVTLSVWLLTISIVSIQLDIELACNCMLHFPVLISVICMIMNEQTIHCTWEYNQLHCHGNYIACYTTCLELYTWEI